MKHQITDRREFNLAEVKFMERLRQHPELLAHFQSILDLTGQAQGPLPTADEVEELLIQELRQLGNSSLNHWACRSARASSKAAIVMSGKPDSKRRARPGSQTPPTSSLTCAASEPTISGSQLGINLTRF